LSGRQVRENWRNDVLLRVRGAAQQLLPAVRILMADVDAVRYGRSAGT